MRCIKPGRTGLDVSPIAIGAMTYGEPGRGHPVWLAWLRRSPAVAAPLLGANKIPQVDAAVASLAIVPSDEEACALAAPCTPRHDFQGISDDQERGRTMARPPGFEPASA